MVSTIPDTVLKGTTNKALLTYAKRVNPSARMVVTADSMKTAKQLWMVGACFVVFGVQSTYELFIVWYLATAIALF